MTFYKNCGKIMARITKNIYEDRTVEILSFKDDNLSNDMLNVSGEALDLLIIKKNRKFSWRLKWRINLVSYIEE